MTLLQRAVALALVLAIGVTATAPCAALAQAPAPVGDRPAEGSDAYDVGAVFANLLWVPAKAAWCGVSTGLALTALVVTLGVTHDWAASAFEEGCLRKWLLTGDDFRPPADVAPATEPAPED
jgi:hypothetical protein